MKNSDERSQQTQRGTADAWAHLADRFVDVEHTSLKGIVRQHVLHQHLLPLLPPPPAMVIDVGGGGGTQSLRLARIGYDVTILDSSAAMLAKAEDNLSRESAKTNSRVRLVQSAGEDAPRAVGGTTYDAVLCHGVIMYADSPDPLIESLCALASSGGLVSIVALNAATMAVRPALEGRWHDALAAFDALTEIGVLGLPTRADTVGELRHLLVSHGVQPFDWYGVWLFADGWTSREPPDDIEDLLAVELRASRQDPYRSLSRLFHLVARKTDPNESHPT